MLKHEFEERMETIIAALGLRPAAKEDNNNINQ